MAAFLNAIEQIVGKELKSLAQEVLSWPLGVVADVTSGEIFIPAVGVGAAYWFYGTLPMLSEDVYDFGMQYAGYGIALAVSNRVIPRTAVYAPPGTFEGTTKAKAK